MGRPPLPRRSPPAWPGTNFSSRRSAVHGRDARIKQGVALRRLGVVGATILGVAAFAGPAQAAGIGAHDAVNVADPTDPFGHLPSFYTDAEGQQVLLCIDPADAA